MGESFNIVLFFYERQRMKKEEEEKKKTNQFTVGYLKWIDKIEIRFH